MQHVLAWLAVATDVVRLTVLDKALRLPAAKQSTEDGLTATPSAALPPRLSSYPILEEGLVGKFPAIDNLGLRHGLAAVEAQKTRDGGDHVGHGQRVRAAHDVRTVEFDLCEGDATLSLANTGGDEGADQGRDGAACRTVGCGPKREEGTA